MVCCKHNMKEYWSIESAGIEMAQKNTWTTVYPVFQNLSPGPDDKSLRGSNRISLPNGNQCVSIPLRVIRVKHMTSAILDNINAKVFVFSISYAWLQTTRNTDASSVMWTICNLNPHIKMGETPQTIFLSSIFETCLNFCQSGQLPRDI